MSILQPEIFKVGTRRYRKNNSMRSTLIANMKNDRSNELGGELKPYEEETADMYEENRCYDDEPCGINKKDASSKGSGEKAKDSKASSNIQGLECSKDGTYRCVMTVAQSYFGFIFGRNGEKKAALERDTQTKINTPGRGKLGDWIAIEGKNKSGVDSCRNRILIIISVARHQKPFTHMLTFPVNFEGMKEKLREFKSLVLKTCIDDRGVDDSIFPYENKLHLTICTLTLLSEYEITEAVDLLEECRRTFIREALAGRPAMVRIRGLEYMNDDPGDVDVLYAKIEPVQYEDNEPNPVQVIADKLLTRFVDSGLSKRQFDRVKLHATIMHSLLRQETSGPDVKRTEEEKSQKSFDVRGILQHYSDFDFGTYQLNEVHLSLRYSSGRDGYYKCVAKVNL